MGIALTPKRIIVVLLFCFFASGYGVCQEKEADVAFESAAPVIVTDPSSQRISLDLKGIDILEFFRILSLKMNVTIVPSKSVTGRVNIFLNNLTFEDALDVVLLSQDLAADRKGTIISVMTASEYEKLYGEKYNEKRKVQTVKLQYAKPSVVFNALGQLKSDIGKVIVDETTGTIIMIDIPERLELMNKSLKDLDRAPQVEVFDLQYARPADVKTHLSSAITTGPGELFVDEKTGKVVVSDLPEKMSKIRTMMKAFDEPTPQVFIEAEIVQVTLGKESQSDINWERLFRNIDGLDVVGTFPVNPSFSPSPALGTSSLTFSIGTVATDKYTATMRFLESLGDAKVLSSPKITVINNQEAKVLVGTREAYITSTQSQADTTTITSESVEFIDVGVKLTLLPTINKEGFITLKIKPEVSRVASTITTEAGSRVPIIETSEAETIVKVKDGTMIMIAGLMREEKRADEVRTPFISRIPLVGMLFRSNTKMKEKTEIVVFVTPHITTGDVSVTGRQIQDSIPADITSATMKEMVLDEKLSELEAGMKSPAAPGSPAAAPAEAKPDEKETMLQERMKGIKNE